MNPDPTKLLEATGIESPPIGLYDVSDPTPFEPFAEPTHCQFACYEDWLRGESVRIARGAAACQGGGYWVGGVEFTAREDFARTLSTRDGSKSSDELMYQWLENQAPYVMENEYVVIGPLRDDQYEHLKTVTFYVNPDQLSLLLIGAEYHNASVEDHPVTISFGSGCGQMAALFGDLETETAKAVIGATDIGMREHLPPDILAFTVNRPMFRQLCELDEDSFLYKRFWERLRRARQRQREARAGRSDQTGATR